MIVVLGVAIALAANQAVEDWSWKGKVREGEARLQRILRDGLAPKPESVDAFLQDSGTVAFCKHQGLPLADWRAVKPAAPDA